MKGGENMATYEKGFKVRLLPTQEQSQKLFQFAGAARFIWNELLRFYESNYDTSKPFIERKDLVDSKLVWQKLKSLRNEKEWLQEVPLHTLNIIQRDLFDAYQRFFKYQWEHHQEIAKSKEYRKGHPNPKRRKDNKWSFPLESNEVYLTYTKDGKLCAHITKIGKVLVKTNFTNLPASKKKKDIMGLLKNVRIKFINNKWILSFMIKCESQAINHSDKVIGIDVGLKILAAATNCNNNDVKIFKNINKTANMRKLDRKLKRYDQQLSNKYNVNNKKDPAHKWQRTKNVEKLLRRRRKLHYHLSNIRKDYLHHVTHEIIAQNPKAIVLEDFALDFMIQNHKLAKITQESLLYEFRRQLTYKCEWNDIELILAPQNYPSSQLCNNCGHKQSMPLEKRTYECPSCGMIMDRDINAAKNLEKYYYNLVH